MRRIPFKYICALYQSISLSWRSLKLGFWPNHRVEIELVKELQNHIPFKQVWEAKQQIWMQSWLAWCHPWGLLHKSSKPHQLRNQVIHNSATIRGPKSLYSSLRPWWLPHWELFNFQWVWVLVIIVNVWLYKGHSRFCENLQGMLENVTTFHAACEKIIKIITWLFVKQNTIIKQNIQL